MIKVIIFTFGAVGGAIVAGQYFRKKYERIAREEIDSVKEVFAKRKPEAGDVRAKANRAKEKPVVTEYAAMVHKRDYKSKKEENTMNDEPYVITPEEFGAKDDYDVVSFTYYADKLLADENDELVDDIKNVVGYDALNSFGEYEDDSVFVRNDRLKCDYEVLLDERKYMDIFYEEATKAGTNDKRKTEQ